MQVVKVFNNNVVLVKNKYDLEEIVMGKGVGFGKFPGDKIEEQKIEKQFASKVKDKDMVPDFEEILKRVDYLDITLASEIFSLFEKRISKKVSETSLLDMADHINFMLKRAKEGASFRTPLEWELKEIYPLEYEISLEAVKLLNEKTGIYIPDMEAAFITLHYVNATSGESRMEETILISKILQNILNIIKYHYGKEFNEATVHFRRFITHIRYFVKRQLAKENVSVQSSTLLSVIKLQYKNDYQCAEKIKNYLDEKYNWSISKDELMYLTLHLNRLSSE
ncbi:PRD domain-containing protein [Oceanobacillus neutriphilus]|uniref:Transcriptional antiterminator n=1 Tax=Oceanobacillus neutriphilus TaxID=531815 RepID=A0ABQ2NR64_9BACI|nr:PRD domain-containing protein [Oceanobacillus neutriphilus]GGP08587.1 transcriptional antiterminator [Oceanobacillus neutriphilus]